MDLIDRNAVLKLPRNVTKNLSGEVIEETIDVDRIKKLQPFECTVDRWCTDCGEYDAKNHRCPRFNRVIREIVDEIKHKSKSVIYHGDVYADGCMVYDTAECPSCGYIFDEEDSVWKEPFCPHCGQRLTWKGEQDE